MTYLTKQTIYQPIFFPPEQAAVIAAVRETIQRLPSGLERDHLHYALASLEGSPELPYTKASEVARA